MAWCSNCNWSGEDYVNKWTSDKKEGIVKCCPKCDHMVGAQSKESYEKEGKPLDLEVHKDKEQTPNQIKVHFLNELLVKGIINHYQLQIAHKEIYNPKILKLNEDGNFMWEGKISNSYL